MLVEAAHHTSAQTLTVSTPTLQPDDRSHVSEDLMKPSHTTAWQVTGSPAEPGGGARLSGPDEAISSDEGDGSDGGAGTRRGGGPTAKGAAGRASRQRKRKEPVVLDEREQRAQKRMVRAPSWQLLLLPGWVAAGFVSRNRTACRL